MIQQLRDRALLGFVALAVGLSLAGCAQGPASSPTDEARIEAAIENAKSGATNEKIAEDLAQGMETTAPAPREAAPTPVKVVDPCMLVARPGRGASDEEMSQALLGFAACARRQFLAADAATLAIEYFKTYRLDTSERPLSTLTDREIHEYIEKHYLDPISFLVKPAEQERRLRASYSDEELVELLTLVARKAHALAEGEARLYAAMDAREELLRYFADRFERYQLLVAFRQTAGDEEGSETAERIAGILERNGFAAPVGRELREFPGWMLHPYGVAAVLPLPGKEETRLNGSRENPFHAVLRARSDLAGTASTVEKTLSTYRAVRDLDNPPPPEHPVAARDAARVAVIDSGIDFVKHPDLALFMGNGEGGQLSSGDFADGDLNPWLPAIGSQFGHGSGTAATILTIMAHYAPDALRSRKLDMAVWKLDSARDLLKGPQFSEGTGETNWASRTGIVEAIVSRIEDDQAKPKIVSVSLGFRLAKLAASIGRSALLLRAPWLWVMAAGNSGTDVSEERYSSCFDDFAAAERVDARILCVGALKQGIVNDKIAGYSNFGERVDVYAFESYIGLCPSGTSCATPAVTGAVAAIAAAYPSLTPEQLKEVIVEASRVETLEVQYDNPMQAAVARSRGLPTARTVKVFDPASMLPRAMELARGKVRGWRSWLPL
ncbi:MAG: S8 family serine peptidase [Oligoflexia bacterium]|nr:S8 family serine peptidase [Oligoflexia bacterium]